MADAVGNSGVAAVETAAAAAVAAAAHVENVEAAAASAVANAEERVAAAQTVAQQITDAALQTEIGRQVSAIGERCTTWEGEARALISALTGEVVTLKTSLSEMATTVAELKAAKTVVTVSTPPPNTPVEGAAQVTETVVNPVKEGAAAITENAAVVAAPRKRALMI